MKITKQKVLPRPTPRAEAIAGFVYLYVMDKDGAEHVVMAIRDAYVFGPETYFINLADGTAFQGNSGNLYELDADLNIKGDAL